MFHPRGHHRHSLHCILPPYLLRSVAQNGTGPQRAAALHTAAVDSTFRSLRFASTQTAQRAPSRIISGMMAESQCHRSIYDLQGQETFPGTLARSEGQGATGDVAVDEAYDGLGATYDLLWEVYGRNSIDDSGMRLNAHVHYGTNYDNAFWDGQRMVFGDGGGDLFNRFTIAIDIIGHELAHGMTEDEGPLVYFRQAGALNESMSDVFGSLVKQKFLNQTADKADWLIGAGLLADGVQGKALRSMKAPGTAYDDPVLGKDPQPGHMRDFVRTWEDNGGVHINSGIPNRAFFLLATQLGGYAWEKAGHIWYEALRDTRLRPDCGFARFARVTLMAAARLYGEGGAEDTAVRDAWNQVGIPVTREKVSVAFIPPQQGVPASKPSRRPNA
ncbi:M4 family metallopeptidase [Corallococcus terminator]|uniref:Neutral metalloproteinase n=1 Tax=Corallococcus terminator TaxID=2316733 RepID=A0A3A8J880_9BACT|nr:M4 family metallopeptidase [Corallococcus terminator]RKG91879.1 peptidase M4 family protein [Corallococcus terminator]